MQPNTWNEETEFLKQRDISITRKIHKMIPPAHFEPPVRTFRATIPVFGSQLFR